MHEQIPWLLGAAFLRPAPVDPANPFSGYLNITVRTAPLLVTAPALLVATTV